MDQYKLLKDLKNHRELTEKKVELVCTLLKNIIQSRLPIKKNLLPLLKKHKRFICKLILPKNKLSLKKRKQILQKGGGVLLTALLPILTSAIYGAVSAPSSNRNSNNRKQ